MKQDGVNFSELRVDGGMVSNNWFSQQLSNTLNLPVLKPKIIETTALGAAYLAGLEAGLFSDLNSLKSNWVCERTFRPEIDNFEELDRKYKRWLIAVEKTKSFSRS